MRAGDVLSQSTVGHGGNDAVTGEQLLPSQCWCGWRYVLVPATLVRVAKTLPCSKGTRCVAKPTAKQILDRLR